MSLFHLLDLAKKVLNWTFSFQIWLNQSHFCSKFEILDLLFILEFLKLKQHFATWIQNSSYIICQKLPNSWLKIAKSLVKNCQIIGQKLPKWSQWSWGTGRSCLRAAAVQIFAQQPTLAPNAHRHTTTVHHHSAGDNYIIPFFLIV